MAQKKKKRESTRKSSELDIFTLISQFAAGGTVLAGKALELVEGLAKKRNLYKSYPYLGEAFSNVKAFLSFLQNSLGVPKPREVKTHERRKSQKSHKKVSKSKTVRHTR